MNAETFTPKRGEILTSRINGKRYRVTRVAQGRVWLANAAAGTYYPRGYSVSMLLKRTAHYWRGEMPAGAKPLHPSNTEMSHARANNPVAPSGEKT